MNNKDFTTTILVDKDAATAFKAITNFRGWWSEEIEGKTDHLNETFFYHYKDVHLSKIKLIEIVPGKKLVYEVMENEFNFTKDKTEWVGTKLIFELTPEGDKTKIVFTHKGLVPEYECYDICHDAWTGYIQGSLQSFITTGIGKPNGKEGGLNAELVEKWGLPDTPANMPSGESFTTFILTDKSPQEVFDAINNVHGWWQGDITGSTNQLNDEFTYEMKPHHLTKQKIVEWIPGKRVVWLVTESRINFVNDKEEWLNTKIIFDIAKEADKTRLIFTHEGLVPAIECYKDCSGAWAQLIAKSLYSFINTGKGVNIF